MASTLPVPSTQILSFGDNGCQVYFSNERYLLLNPYMDKDGKRYGGGWSLFGLPECLLVEDPDSHQKSGNREHFANLSLAAVLALVEQKLAIRFELCGAPADIPDRYPIFYDDHPGQLNTDIPPQGEQQQLSLF